MHGAEDHLGKEARSTNAHDMAMCISGMRQDAAPTDVLGFLVSAMAEHVLGPEVPRSVIYLFVLLFPVGLTLCLPPAKLAKVSLRTGAPGINTLLLHVIVDPSLWPP